MEDLIKTWIVPVIFIAIFMAVAVSMAVVALIDWLCAKSISNHEQEQAKYMAEHPDSYGIGEL